MNTFVFDEPSSLVFDQPHFKSRGSKRRLPCTPQKESRASALVPPPRWHGCLGAKMSVVPCGWKMDGAEIAVFLSQKSTLGGENAVEKKLRTSPWRLPSELAARSTIPTPSAMLTAAPKSPTHPTPPPCRHCPHASPWPPPPVRHPGIALAGLRA